MKLPVLFTSKGCGACKEQLALLQKHLNGKKVFIVIVDVDKHDVPFIQYTPTWYIPRNDGKYDVYDSIITNPKDFDKLVVKSNDSSSSIITSFTGRSGLTPDPS
jgi:hypothetical protein